MSASASKKKRKELGEEGLSLKEIAAKKEAEKRKKKLRNILIPVISVLVVAAIVFGVIALINAPYRQTAATIGDEKISVPVYHCFYNYTANNLYSQFASYGLIKQDVPLSEQPGFGNGDTMEQYMIDACNQSMASAYNLYIAARADKDFKLPQDHKDAIDDAMDQLEQTAESYGFASVNDYLQAAMNKGVKPADYKTYLTVMEYATAYSEYLQETYQPSDDELAAKYDEAKDDYDFIVVTSSTTTAESTKDEDGKTTYTDVAKAKAKEDAEAKKAEMPEDASERYFQKEQATQYSEDMADWLFDAARKEGDTEMFALNADETSFITLRYERRETNDYQRVNGYILTITKPEEKDEEKADDAETPTEAPTETPTEAPTETPTEAPTEAPTETPTEEEEKEETAEEKLAKLKEALTSGMSDEDFEAKVKELGYSTSKRSYSKSDADDAVIAWFMDENRKAGDMDYIETDTAYYAVRFVDRQEQTYRQELVRSVMFNAFYSDLTNKYELKVDSDALKYVKTDLTFHSSSSAS